MIPIRARIGPQNVRYYARAPVVCCKSHLQYFALVELRGTVGQGGGVLTLLGHAPLGEGKGPVCLSLPGLVRQLVTTPGFVCPACGAAEGALLVPETGTAKDDLLHSCLRPYSREACACGLYRSRRLVDCPPLIPSPFEVRGELVTLHKDRAGRQPPPGLPARLQPGGRE